MKNKATRGMCRTQVPRRQKALVAGMDHVGVAVQPKAQQQSVDPKHSLSRHSHKVLGKPAAARTGFVGLWAAI